MSRLLYSLGWYLATPLVVAYLLWRSRQQPAYRRHWAERWAVGGPRPADGVPTIWIHAVSVGETRAAQPLVAALRARHPGVRILLTAMTPTGRETGESLFGDRVVQVFLPYDYPGAMRRFLARWQPAIGIVMETELWPNLVAASRSAGVPLALVNARLSERSLRKGLRWHRLIVPALAGLDLVAAQSAGDAQRLARLGRPADVVTGNLKFDVAPTQAAVALGRRWREALGTRPVLLCASTRDGEEALLLSAWQALPAQRRGDILLVVVPRHPQRFDEVAASCAQAGLAAARRSEGALEDGRARTAGLLLGDSMGEMFAWYALADVAIIGGSLLPFGAQNLIEACALSVPVVLGPHVFNFAEASAEAVAAGAALQVPDAAAALDAACALIADGTRRAAMADAAGRFAAAHRGATARTLEALAPHLARLSQ